MVRHLNTENGQATTYTREQIAGLSYVLRLLSDSESACVLLEREPGSDHGWIEVIPTTYGTKPLALWKHTGAVYEIGSDGAVHDDPIFTP